MKNITIAFALCFLGFCPTQDQSPAPLSSEWDMAIVEQKKPFTVPLPPVTRLGAGAYISSRFAQQNHDWKNANKYIASLLETHTKEETILERAMILAMGSGDYARAVELANKISANGNNKTPEQKVSLTVSHIFLIADSFSKNNPTETDTLIENLPSDSTANFVKPFLQSWNAAAAGKLDISTLNANTIQLYHAILISDFLDDHTELEKILGRAVAADQDNPADFERIADLYAHAGLKEKALALYKKIQKEWPDEIVIKEKINTVENGTNKPIFEKVNSAKAGMATAFYDIASALSQDYNDESATVFGNLALMLNPDMVEPKFLLAQISARHDQDTAAINYYKQIPAYEKSYIPAQFKIAELLEDTGKLDEALSVLQALEKDHNSVEVQISLGDFYRGQKNFNKALDAYNTAKKLVGKPISSEHWNLHYASGICYEQMGNWSAAEIELKKALEMNPDHPHILNYLGYAWADRGIHLDEALELIKRAVELRPQDGYIVDSLGWVLFKRGDYEKAVPYLENAIALLPYDPTINDHLGDAYWKVGRHREARFQWLRAKNQAEESGQINTLSAKLENGLASDSNIVGKNTLSQ